MFVLYFHFTVSEITYIKYYTTTNISEFHTNQSESTFFGDRNQYINKKVNYLQSFINLVQSLPACARPYNVMARAGKPGQLCCLFSGLSFFCNPQHVFADRTVFSANFSNQKKRLLFHTIFNFLGYTLCINISNKRTHTCTHTHTQKRSFMYMLYTKFTAYGSISIVRLNIFDFMENNTTTE